MLRLPGYEVVRPIGRGGMGEVFEAIRVGPAGFKKSVAIKQLPSERAIDGASVQRFLQEARISAQLDHPNIVRIHDLVVQEGYFLVMELLRGWNLSEAIKSIYRSSVGAPAPPSSLNSRWLAPTYSWRTGLELAEQALAGLAYAHALTDEAGRSLGLVHRDLTPRNLFLTETGTVKILDFGLAKLVNALTPGLTEAGHLHGTLSFLAPEQARAEASDPKSDLYQLGGVIYWLLSDRTPNGSGPAGEVLARAANRRPTPLIEMRPDLPGAVVALVDRAMAFEPKDRFGSAAEMRSAVQAALRDAGDQTGLLDLIATLPPVPRGEPISREPVALATGDVSATLVRGDAAPTAQVPQKTRPRRGRRATLAVAAIAAALVGYAVSEAKREVQPAPKPASVAQPIYKRMTFRPGFLISARFAPGGRTIIHSGSWGGEPVETVEKDTENPNHRSLDLKGSELVGIAPDGKLALLTDASFIFSFVRKGTLAEASLAGGTPRERLVDIQDAEWTPSGELVILRWNGARTTLEKLPDQVLVDAGESTWFGQIRISQEGRIALSEHPIRHDDRGRIVLYDPEQKRTVPLLAEDWSTIEGLAWGPDGREVWFTGARQGASRGLYAVSLNGEVRSIEQVPGSLNLFDVDREGRALLSHESTNNRVYLKAPDAEEVDVSWFDFDAVFDIAADGSAYVFLQGASDASGDRYLAYLRRTSASPAVQIAEGIPLAISPDGSRVVVIDQERMRIQIVPTRAGETFTVTSTSGAGSAAWFPDGRRVLIGANTGHGISVLDTETKQLSRLPIRGLLLPILGNPIAPDGARFAAIEAATSDLVVTDLEGGPLQRVKSALPGEQVLRWTPDGEALLVAHFGDTPFVIARIDLATGERSRWRSISPSDPVGVAGIVTAAITPDLEWYVYSATRVSSTLYLVEKLR